MNIEVKDLMDQNEMLSHIFLGCIPVEKLEEIRDKYIDEKDWNEESVKIPVSMKIGGVSVNPKGFFDEWKKQMQKLILEKAQEIVAEKLGSAKFRDMEYRIAQFEQIIREWESEINWEVENPFIDIENQ
jgi:hypothetical protein